MRSFLPVLSRIARLALTVGLVITVIFISGSSVSLLQAANTDDANHITGTLLKPSVPIGGALASDETPTRCDPAPLLTRTYYSVLVSFP